MTHVACLGECMIELVERPDGLLSRGFGGDTLNTAVYLARLGVAVDYVTALGTDPFSDEMLRAWQREGIGTRMVARVEGRVPGLYLIQTDRAGERRFSYWRDSAPVRQLFDLPQASEIAAALANYDLLYLSGITLSLFGDAGRERLFATLDQLRANGGRVAFDTNFRPRGWSSLDAAHLAYGRMLACSDIVLASEEDFALLSGKDAVSALANRLKDSGAAEIVIKLATPGCVVHTGGARDHRLHGAGRRDCGYDRGRRQFRRGLSRCPPCRRRTGGCREIRPSPGGSGRMPPWRDHPACRHARRCSRRAGFGGSMTQPTTTADALLRAAKLIPVLTIENVEHAVPLARALVAGGVRTLEITLRTEAGLAAARAIKMEVPEATPGLGTVLSPRDLLLAKEIGLPFAFSPGATAELLDAAMTSGVAFVPGIATASELMAVRARGFTTVKLFPAEQLGGIATVRALGGPFPEVSFCPTGGIGEDRISAYFQLSNVAAVGGSWLAPAGDIRQGNWAAITERARRVMQRIAP